MQAHKGEHASSCTCMPLIITGHKDTSITVKYFDSKIWAKQCWPRSDCTLEKQFDQGFHCLPFHLYVIKLFSYEEITLEYFIMVFEIFWPLWYEPWHEISNNVVCATSKASDQPAHTRSLIRTFASRLNILWVLSYWLNIIWSFWA